MSWFLFYAFIPFALYACTVSLYPIHHMKLRREFNKQAYQSGEQLTVTITVRRKGFFPILFLVVQDILPNRLNSIYGESASRVMFFPFLRRELKFNYSLPEIPRGKYHFTKMQLKMGDFFGLGSKESTYEVEGEFVVYPRIVQIEESPFFISHNEGNRFSLAWANRGDAFVSGVREYQPGDQCSSIDWKASAKKSMLVSKEFEQIQSRDVHVILDGVSTFGLEPRITFFISLLSAYMNQGMETNFISLGLYSYAENLTFQNKNRSLQKVLFYLAGIEGDGHIDFAALLNQYLSKRDSSGPACILISQLTEQLTMTLEREGRQRHLTVFIVKEKEIALSPAEQALANYLLAQQVNVQIRNEIGVSNMVGRRGKDEGNFAHS